jgi:hypothetical protein
VDQLDRVPGGARGAVVDLLAAGEAGGRDHGVLGLGVDRREQPVGPDGHGHVEMLGLESE